MPLDTPCYLNVRKTLEDLQDTFWTSYVRSIYVLYPARVEPNVEFILVSL